MKKQLLNQKSVAQLFFSLFLTLLCINSVSSQTVLDETFGTTAQASYTGGTSTPSVTYNQVNTTYNKINTLAVSSETFLNFASLATAVTTQAASTTLGSNSVILVAPNANISVGQVVTGTGVPTSGTTTVTAISGNTITLSANAASTNATTTLSFFKADARVSLAGALPPETSGLKGNLQTNDKLITWTFNMKASRLSTNAFSATTAYQSFKYFSGVVLCTTSDGLLSNSANPGTGYAVTLQKGSATGTKPSIHLIKFTKGLGDAAAPESSVVTKLIESPELNQIPAGTVPNNLSIKVTYNKNADVWELLYREDPNASPFVDPSSGTHLLGGSFIDVPTSTPMTHFGFVAGLQVSANSSNTYQFDNFKIGLSTLPAYTSPPTVEKRQAFNSAANPTVANLVALGSNAATFKWYTAPTGGSSLATSTSLTSSNYYVSQTVNGTESTRVASQVFVGDTALKTLPLYEGFANYTIGDKLLLMNNGASTAVATNQATGLGSWSMAPSANITDDVTIAATPAWTNLIAPATATGNAITLVGSGIDPELKFTNTTTGSLYSSFVFTATDPLDTKTPFASFLFNAQKAADDAALAKTPPDPVPVKLATGIDATKSTPTGFYSFLSESIDPTTSVVSTQYTSSVMFRKNIATGKFNIGLSKSNNAAETSWSETEYDFDKQYMIAISYENIGDATATNQVANLWVNPSTNTLPLPAPTLTQSSPTTSVSRDHIDRIKILQASSASTPILIIDEIRVANNWGTALGGASTLGVAKMNVSKFSVYPNPVVNGKMNISSANNSEKQVAIYSLLGQKVFETKAANNTEINVSKLAKGTYILNVTEDGTSENKKIIIR